MQRFFEGKKWLLLIAIVLAGSHARAQGTKDTLTLNLDKALEIALSDNPTIKVAEEEIALKKVSRKETWQNLLPEASITGSMSHTITAPQFSIGDQIVKMGQDKANTAAGTLNISLPLFAPFRLSRHVDDQDGYRAGCGEVAGFQTGFGEPGDQSLLSADAVAGLVRSFAEKL